MRELKAVLVCMLLAALASLALCGVMFVRAATEAVAELPGQVTATRDELRDQVAAARIDAFAEIGEARKELLAKSDAQLNALRVDVMGQATAAREVADRRVGDSLGRVDAAIALATPAAAAVTHLAEDTRAELKAVTPVLANAAALEKDAQDSWDAMYDDLNAAVQSSNVVLTQVGQAALESREAAVANTKSVAGITADVHAMTTAALKPKSFWGKVWAGVTVFSRFAGLL